MNKLSRTAIFTLLLFRIVFPLGAVDVFEDIIRPAEALTGSPYRYGAAGPNQFDCSGLVYYLYRPLLPSIPRSSRDFSSFGTPVDRNSLKPGDLVLFATTGGPGTVSHIAIYIGQESVVHAVSNGPQTGVIVSSLESGYWNRTYHSARRVLARETVAPERGETTIVYDKGRYTGPIAEGEPSGSGVMYLNNGDVYRGQFENGTFNGRGTYTWRNGGSYSGEFVDGKIEGGIASSDAPPDEETYLESADSPWDDWDGEVYGDYREWRSREEEAFEAFKERDKAGSRSTLP